MADEDWVHWQMTSPIQCAAANRLPALQSDGSDNLSAIVAADRAFPAAVAELGRWAARWMHFAMRHINSDLRPEVLTVFLMPPRQFAELSSSMVKGMVGPEGWESVVRRCVPPCVFQALKAVHGGRHA